MSRNWKFWVRSFKLHARANNITDDGRKVALLLNRAGRHVQTLFYAIGGPNADEKTFDETIILFDTKFERKPNLLCERSLFSAMRQQKEESFAQSDLRLREKADVCEFGDADRVDRVILDQLVPNLCNLELKYKILETEDLSLETALAEAQLIETLWTQVPHMGGKQQTVDKHDAPNSVNVFRAPSVRMHREDVRLLT